MESENRDVEHRVDLARLLLDKGASARKANGIGKTALRWCRDAALEGASWGWARAPGDDYELVESSSSSAARRSEIGFSSSAARRQ